MKTKKEIRNEYKVMKFRAGIYQIINNRENKIYLRTTTDLDRAFNSDIFKLNAGLHPNKNLQNDWNNYGHEAFEFKIFDELSVKETATPTEINQDLNDLLKIHISELEKSGQALY